MLKVWGYEEQVLNTNETALYRKKIIKWSYLQKEATRQACLVLNHFKIEENLFVGKIAVMSYLLADGL